MSYEYGHDVEKGGVVDAGSAHSQEKRHSITGVAYADGAVPGESFELGNGWYAKVQRLAGKMNVEQRGIERVPEDERTDAGFKALLNVSTMVCYIDQYWYL